MKRYNQWFVLLLLMTKTFGAALLANIASDNVQNSVITTTQSQNAATLTINNASEFDLTTTELQTYQQLMQGPSGLWYQQLTPAAVLGINTNNANLRWHYAEIVAREEHNRLNNELLFNSLVHQALVQLYANELLIKPFDKNPFSIMKSPTVQLQAGDELAYFVDVSHPYPLTMTSQLLSLLTTNSNTTLVIDCVNATMASDINTWALLNGIPKSLVMSHRIQLLSDTGQWQQLQAHASLPYLLLIRNSQSRPIQLPISI